MKPVFLVLLISGGEIMLKITGDKILVEEKEDLMRYPVLSAGDNVELFVDGNLIEKRAIVTGDSDIKYRIKDKDLSYSSSKTIDVEVTEDEMEAYLEIKIQPAKDYQVKLVEQKGVSVLVSSETSREYPEVKKSEILQAIQQAGIIYGIDQEVISSLVNTQENQRVLIAKGKEPKPGRPARIEPVNIREESNIEYFHKHIISVLPGQVIAVKKEATPGQKGTTVRGKTIRLSPPDDPEIILGDNVMSNPAGNKIIALEAGRPVIEHRKDSVKVSVIQQHRIEGDIDRDTGKISYSGDLIVTGSIQDFFGVNIEGILKVRKHINNAEIITGGDIYAGHNIIGANLKIGISSEKDDIIDELFNKNINIFIGTFEKMLNIYNEDREVVKIDRKFRTLISNSKKLSKIKSELISSCQQVLKNKRQENNPFKDSIKLLHQYLLGYKNYSKDSYAQLKEIANKIDNKLYRQQAFGKSNLAAGYIQNSEITASGDIYLFQQGVYTSTIKTAGNIIGNNKTSFFKGGTYNTGGWFAGGAVGAELGTTKIKVKAGFLAREIKGNVIVVGPEDKMKFSAGSKNIYIKVNEDGRFESHSWPGWQNWIDDKVDQNIKRIWSKRSKF